MYRLRPMNSSLMWPKTLYIPSLPHKVRWMPGRPTIKTERHPSEAEDRPHIHKKAVLITCNICKARNIIKLDVLKGATHLQKGGSYYL